MEKNLLKLGYLYQSPDNVLQPVEQEAYGHQIRLLKRICEKVTSKYGRNDQTIAFENYIRDREEWFDNKKEEAKKLYGDRYPEAIKKKIRLKSRIIKEFYRKHIRHSSLSDFFDYLSYLVEDFVGKNLEGDCSLKAFEQFAFRMSEFKEAFKRELARQSVIGQFNRIMGRSLNRSLGKPREVVKLFREYLVNHPDETISLEEFKDYLEKKGSKKLIKWFNRKELKNRIRAVLTRNAERDLYYIISRSPIKVR